MSAPLTPPLWVWVRVPILTPEQLADHVRAGTLGRVIRETRREPVRLSDSEFAALMGRLTR